MKDYKYKHLTPKKYKTANIQHNKKWPRNTQTKKI